MAAEPGHPGPAGDGAARVVTAGETMLLVVPSAPGRLRHATDVTLSIGGAESNVAIGLSRLGIASGWVSALGEDEPGDLVLHRIRAEGVDTGAVRTEYRLLENKNTPVARRASHQVLRSLPQNTNGGG